MSTTNIIKLEHSPAITNFARSLAVIGAVVFVAGWIISPVRAWSNFLLVSVYLLGIGLGTGFFLAGLHLCGAKWAKAIHCLPEKLWIYLPVGAIGILTVLLIHPSLYAWYNPTPELEHHLVSFKGMWLNRPFMLFRAIVFLATWIFLIHGCVKASRRSQPNVGRWAAGFVAVLMLTIWMAASDWIMSLEPEWFSTMFGFYVFAGCFSSAIAVMIIVGLWLRNKGILQNVFTEQHMHDLGKLQFAFCTFWMYIWFSQYMLIWYTNIPEESNYFVQRIQGPWAPLLVVNLFLNWIIPFFALLSARAKRNSRIMLQIAVIVLVGHWLDLYIMILPTAQAVGDGLFPFGIWEIGIAAGGIGIFLLVFQKFVNLQKLKNSSALHNATLKSMTTPMMSH